MVNTLASSLEKPFVLSENTTEQQQHKSTVRLTLTIDQYLQLLKRSKLIDTPTFNRGKIAKPEWKRKIISSIFMGLDLPKFVLWIKSGTLLKKVRAAQYSGDKEEAFNLLLNDVDQRYPIIDAVQRTTAISEFAASKLYTESTLEFTYNEQKYSKIEVGNCCKKDLDVKLFKEIFLNYFLDITLFYGSDEEASDYFVALNKGNTMNDQQIRNSFISAAGDYVKATANIIHSYDETNTPRTTHHVLFDIETIKEKGRVTDAKLRGKYIKTGVKRMEFDKFLSYCIAYSSWERRKPTKTPVTGIDGQKLDSMYINSYKYEFGETPDSKSIKKLVEKNMDDMLEMLKTRKYYKQATAGACLNLYMLIDNLRKDYFLRIDDHAKFSDWFFKVHHELCKKVKDDGGRERENDFSTTTRLGFTGTQLQFRLNSLYVKLSEKIKHDLNGRIVLGEYKDLGIRILDKNRNITDSQAVDMFHEQGGKCAATGEDITQVDMIKSHLKPHSEGGISDTENVVLTTKPANRPKVEELVLSDGEEEEDPDDEGSE